MQRYSVFIIYCSQDGLDSLFSTRHIERISNQQLRVSTVQQPINYEAEHMDSLVKQQHTSFSNLNQLVLILFDAESTEQVQQLLGQYKILFNKISSEYAVIFNKPASCIVGNQFHHIIFSTESAVEVARISMHIQSFLKTQVYMSINKLLLIQLAKHYKGECNYSDYELQYKFKKLGKQLLYKLACRGGINIMCLLVQSLNLTVHDVLIDRNETEIVQITVCNLSGSSYVGFACGILEGYCEVNGLASSHVVRSCQVEYRFG